MLITLQGGLRDGEQVRIEHALYGLPIKIVDPIEISNSNFNMPSLTIKHTVYLPILKARDSNRSVWYEYHAETNTDHLDQ